jgi:hypothetical protein
MQPAKSKNHLFAGKPNSKKGLAKPAPFLKQKREKPSGFPLCFLQKRKNRIFPFLQIPGLPGEKVGFTFRRSICAGVSPA